MAPSRREVCCRRLSLPSRTDWHDRRANIATPPTGPMQWQATLPRDLPLCEFLSMSASTSSQSLLEELDARQDEVLEQLEKLNARIERVLKECILPQEPQLRLVGE